MKKERAISVSLTNGAECICDPDIVLGDKYGLWDINNEVSPRGTLLDLNAAWELLISKQGFSSYTFEQQEDSEHERITYVLVDQDKNPVGPEFTVETDNGATLVPITETITSLTTEKGKYYRLDAPVETLAITLPAMDTVESVKKVGIYFTAGTTPDVTITAADGKLVVFQDGFELEAGKTYKISALFDGSAWVVSTLTIIIPPPMNIITYEASAKLSEVTGTWDSGLHTNAFSGTSGQLTITSHTFENNVGTIEFNGDVTIIGERAFKGCSGLTSIDIPSGVTSIGSSAFSGCSGLTSIVVDSANTVYDSRDNCNAIIHKSTNELIKGCKNTIIPNTVTSIGQEAFGNCTGLTSITIPDSVTNIGNYAFSACSGLTSVTIGSGVTSIGSSAFGNCSSLTSINIPDGVTNIGNYAFQNCSGLTSVTIGSGVTNISNGVTNISNGIFKGCSGLTSVTIPDSVTSIGQEAFGNCTGLTSITIPDNVTSTGDNAFAGCSSLTSVTIGSRVTSIGNSTFAGCSSLTSITIPDSVTSIGDNAFHQCSSLTNITSNAITAPTIQSYTFYNVKTGGTLRVPSGSTDYDKWMRTGNYYLGKYNWTKVELPFFAKLTLNNGEVVELEGSGQLTSATVLQYKNTLVSAKIGELCTSIGAAAFGGCSNLTSIDIPSSVTSIDIFAFGGCESLTSITCNATIAPSILSSTFQDVKTGGTLHVPIGNTGYDVWMGTGNYYLGKYSWTIAPMNIITYEASAKLAETTIQGSPGLHTNVFSGTSGQLTMTSHTFENGVGTIIFNGDVTSIGACAFQYCSGLTSITIPNSVTSIGNNAFLYCSGLTSITIPNSVTSIGQNAFSGCTGLTSITIPDSVTIIGNGAFNGCSGLMSITCNATTAPTIQSATFKDVKTNGTLIVPSGSTGYDVWMGTGNSYLGKYNWTKVEQ